MSFLLWILSYYSISLKPRGCTHICINTLTRTCKCKTVPWWTEHTISCMQILYRHQTLLPPVAARRTGWGLRCPCRTNLLLFRTLSLSENKEGASWRKAVPSYTQSSSAMDFRTWSSLPRDDSLEPLPLNWEMAYTETGMVYFIEWVLQQHPYIHSGTGQRDILESTESWLFKLCYTVDTESSRLLPKNAEFMLNRVSC